MVCVTDVREILIDRAAGFVFRTSQNSYGNVLLSLLSFEGNCASGFLIYASRGGGHLIYAEVNASALEEKIALIASTAIE
jgi:hypothetical protein